VSFPEYVASWLDRYPTDQPWVDDDANFALRQSESRWLDHLRARPDLAEDDIKVLLTWKFRRGAFQSRAVGAVTAESAKQVSHAIAYASDHAGDDRRPMDLICRVPGFGVATASVFLALRFPGRFVIADSRALRTLRNRRGFARGPSTFVTANDWVPYLEECRKILAECRESQMVPSFEREWTMRCVDQALYAANGE
jgi:hypothetical protein